MSEMISIIVPVYNSEKYLRKCLDSLINQSYENIEVLCVNDGSTDNSHIILDEYAQKDSRVKIFLQKNSGPAVARNKALEESNGQYIMFCDSDDWYEADMCKKMLDAVKETDADLVSCDCNIISDIETQRTKDTEHYFSNKILGLQKVSSALISNINYALWLKLFKKDIIENNKIRFPENLYSCEDASFIIKYLLCSKTYFGFQEMLYNYRILEDSIISNVYSKHCINKILYDRILMVLDVFNFLKQQNIEVNKNKFILELLNREFVATYHHLNNKEERKYAYNLCNNILNNIHLNDLKTPDLYILKLIKAKKYKKLEAYIENKLYNSFLQNIFSIKNIKDYKVLTFLFFKIKIKNKMSILLNKIQLIIDEIKDIKQSNKRLTEYIKTSNAINDKPKQLSRIDNFIKTEYEKLKLQEIFFLKHYFKNFTITEQEYKNLIKGLDHDSIIQVNEIINYINEINNDIPKQINEEYKNLIIELYEKFYSKIIKITDGLWAYDQYLLPLDRFEPSVYYNKHCINKFKKQYYENLDIIDIGGFIGDSLPVLSPLTNSTVHTFEPSKKNYTSLLKTIELNNLKNIKANNYALSDEISEITFYVSLGESDSSILPVFTSVDEYPVHTDTLDNYVAQNNIQVGLIKIDVEGFEQSVIRGAMNTIKTQRPDLLISIYHNSQDFKYIKPIIDNLNLGYKFKIIKPKDLNIVLETVLIAQCI